MKKLRTHLQHGVDFLKTLRQMPYASIEFSGNENARQVFRRFSSPHPKYIIVPKKALGVALVDLSISFSDYLKAKGELKRKRNKALKRGYSVSVFDPNEYLDDILAVNSSMSERQGRAIDPEYLDLESLKHYFSGKNMVFGAFREGRLFGYIDLLVHGEISIISRILGHAEHLDDGVMYLLVSAVVEQMISRNRECGNPKWIMYDTVFGASEGLRAFKEKCGFTPFFVRWRWKEAA